MSHDLKFSHRDITVNCAGESLVIENAALKRSFDLSTGVPVTTELFCKNNNRLIADSADACDFSFIGMNMPDYDAVTDYRIESVSVSAIEASMFDGEKVEVRILIHEPVQQLTFERICIIYPESFVLFAGCFSIAAASYLIHVFAAINIGLAIRD